MAFHSKPFQVFFRSKDIGSCAVALGPRLWESAHCRALSRNLGVSVYCGLWILAKWEPCMRAHR